MIYDQLSSLDTSKTAWKVRVRVTRMWPSVSNSSAGSEVLKGFNLLLLDDDDCHVHAFVYADNWKTIADKIAEGGIYIVSNFYTKEASGSLKPVSSNILINFSHSTIVEKVAEDDFMIPMHKFEFIDLGDLFSVASSYKNADFPDYSVDVIGVLEDYQPLSTIKTKYGEKQILKFSIADGRHSHKVTVWGTLAASTHAQYERIVERPIIAILASTKLRTFRNSVQLNTLPSSKIYLNLENEVVTAMRQRLTEEGYVAAEKIMASPTNTDSSSEIVIETLTLKQLSEKTHTKYLKSNFLCKVNVKTVEENDNWWYFCCNKNNCHEEVSKIEGKYKCFKCNRNYPIAQKRYKIVVLAEDETEAFNFVLFDRAAKRMIGKTATKLIAETIDFESSKAYPADIKNLNGKDMILKIELNEDNILLKSSIYYATDAYNCGASLMSDSTSNTVNGSSSEYVEINAESLAENTNTPGSAKSTSKKIKMET